MEVEPKGKAKASIRRTDPPPAGARDAPIPAVPARALHPDRAFV